MRVISFDKGSKPRIRKGSKRRIRQVRWRPSEIISLLLLALFTITIAGLVVSWVISHDSFEPDAPYLQDRR